jgi:hypothetical protein
MRDGCWRDNLLLPGPRFRVPLFSDCVGCWRLYQGENERVRAGGCSAESKRTFTAVQMVMDVLEDTRSPGGGNDLSPITRASDGSQKPICYQTFARQRSKAKQTIRQVGFRKSTAWEEFLANAIFPAERRLDNEERDNLTECMRLMMDRGPKMSSRTAKRAVKILRECMSLMYPVVPDELEVDTMRRGGDKAY